MSIRHLPARFRAPRAEMLPTLRIGSVSVVLSLATVLADDELELETGSGKVARVRVWDA